MTVSYCPDCGSAVAADDNFCSECGGDLNPETPTHPVTERPHADGEVREMFEEHRETIEFLAESDYPFQEDAQRILAFLGQEEDGVAD